MIKTQIINEDSKPVAVVLDYGEYLRLKKIEEDASDYMSALEVKEQNTSWITHAALKRELDL